MDPFRPDADFLNREPIADFSNLANLDAKDIMEVVSAKVLDSYTIWDLLLEKARLRVQEDIPAMVTIMAEVSFLVTWCYKCCKLGLWNICSWDKLIAN